MSNDRLLDALEGRGPSLEAEFLSVDVDAQLRKLASRSFRSPHEYPVELVRDALRRGATVVQLRISSRRMEVKDNGAAFDEQTVKKMHLLLNPELPAWERHSALELLSGAGRLGLLSAWAPSPTCVQVYSSDVSWQWFPGRGPEALACTSHSGNRVCIRRRNADWRKEREEVIEACRFSPRAVILDGVECSIRGGRLHDLVSGPVCPGEGVRGGTIWIPRRGDVCRIHLLADGIRWRTVALSAGRNGLVFEAAVESPECMPDGLVLGLRRTALRLYFALVNSYEVLPLEMRNRVDELVFGHYRASGDAVILDRFSAFRRLSDRRLLSIGDVRQMALGGAVNVLLPEEKPGRFCVEGSQTLVVTRRQRDFLASEGLALSSPRRRPVAPARLRSWLSEVSNMWRRLRGRLGLPGSPGLEPHLLEASERAFLEQLDSMVRERRFRLPWTLEGEEAQVRLQRGRRAPRVLRHQGKTVLVIGRGHRWTRLAVDALQAHPGNIRMVLPLLTMGHDGWE